jgi:hypothetical protein
MAVGCLLRVDRGHSWLKKGNGQPRRCLERAAPRAEDNPAREGERISGRVWPFLAYPEKDRLMHDRQDLTWDRRQLRLLSNRGVVLATIEPDKTWPGMWCVRRPAGNLTDMVSPSRAKDAAASVALSVLNQHREAA